MQKIIVLTGGSSGLGQALLQEWEQQGHIVIHLSRTNPQQTKHFVPCDVTKLDQIQQAFAMIQAQYGKIDILVNNAGYGISGAMELIEPQKMENVFQVNVFGQYAITQQALPLMQKGGKIVNIASVCAIFPLCFRGIYCASKSAQAMMSLSLRMELNPDIDVVTICPADIKTNFTKHRVKEMKTNERYGNRIEKAMMTVDAKEDKRMPVSKAVAKIDKIVKKKKTKPLYIIGTKMKVLAFLMRFFPLGFLLYWTEKLYGGHTK